MKSVAKVLNHSKKPMASSILKAAVSPLEFILKENSLRGKDILGIADLTATELNLLLKTAALLKKHKGDETQLKLCKGQSLAMLFEKPSLRTRVSFDLAMQQLGGHAVFLEGPLGVRESIGDVAKNLEKWVDAIMARTFLQSTLDQLAVNASIPVISGLSDIEHPCQALADMLTIQEKIGYISGAKIAFIGDGNNVAHSLAIICAKLGADFILACPPEYMPDPITWEKAVLAAESTGATISITHDPVEAVSGADVIYTDTWTSMGQEAESAVRKEIFAPFQVNDELLAHSKEPSIVMHCLPAHRGEEITNEVIDGPKSVVFDQAENRLHAQKAILALVL